MKKIFSSTFIFIYSLFVLLVAVYMGAYFRFANLHATSLYMDSQDFLCPFDYSLKLDDIFTRWIELPTGKNHLPFPVYLNTLIIRMLNIPPLIGNLALPAASIGVLIVIIAFIIGTLAKNIETGSLFALMVAFNPIVISISRTPYYYIFALLGFFLSVLALVMLLKYRETKIEWPYYVIMGVGNFICFYSDSSVWAYSFIINLFSLGLLYKNKKHLFIFCALNILIGLPVAFQNWGLPTILKETFFYSPQAREYWTSVFYGTQNNNIFAILTVLFKIIFSYLFGFSLIRFVLGLCAISLMVYFVIKNFTLPMYKIIFFVLVASILLQTFAVSNTVVPVTHARYLYTLPLLYLLCCMSLYDFVQRIFVRNLSRANIGFVSISLIIAMAYLQPAYLAATQTGRSQPHLQIAKWLDQNLPKGAIVITERFFDAFNEYKRHPATNVFITSTIRNQTAQEYLGNKFRERTEGLIMRNPVSALIQTEILWDHKDVGPWLWPEKFYARSVTITNEAGLKLHKLGLADMSIPGNKQAEKIYQRKILYNLPEDIINKAKEKNVNVFLLKGQDWRYLKTQDFNDWSVLLKEATIYVFNFMNVATSVSIKITGVAVGPAEGQKIISFNNHIIRLPFNKWLDFESPKIDILPGTNNIVIKDVSTNQRELPLLLVQDIYVLSDTNKTMNPYWWLMP